MAAAQTKDPETVRKAIERIQRNDPEYTDTRADLVNKALTDEHIHEIANALCGNTYLKILSLSQNNISDNGIKALSHALTSTQQGGGGNSTLKWLNLGKNNISDNGVKALSHALTSTQQGGGGNSTLERLFLEKNNIS